MGFADLSQEVSVLLDTFQPVVDVRALWEQFTRKAGTTSLFFWENVLLYGIAGLLIFVWHARGSRFTLREALRSLVPPQLSSPAVKVDVQFFIYDLLGLRRLALVGLSVLLCIPVFTHLVRGLHLWTQPGFAVASAWAQHLDPLPRSGLAFALSALGSEFAFYWYHRAAHRWEILWQFHKVHHYAEEMNPMVAIRVHDFDETLQIQCLFLGGMLFAGTLFPLTEDTSYTESAFWMVAAYQVLLRVSSRFAHSHIPFTLGPVLDRVLNTALIHQMHHSRDVFDTNFGQSLSIWDTVFGTYYRPKPDEVVRFGVPDAREDEYRSLIHAQIQPYIEVARIVRRRLRRAAPEVAAPDPERSTGT